MKLTCLTLLLALPALAAQRGNVMTLEAPMTQEDFEEIAENARQRRHPMAEALYLQPMPGVVLGQVDEAPREEPKVEQVAKTVEAPMIDAVLAGVLALIALVGRAVLWLTGSSKFARAGVLVVEHLAGGARRLVEGLEPDIKLALANDGVIDEKERGQLLDKMVELLLAELPTWAVKALRSNFGESLLMVLKNKAAGVLDDHLGKLGVPLNGPHQKLGVDAPPGHQALTGSPSPS